MAAIVSGNSLGLLNSSLYVLGSQGAVGQAPQGRAAEQVYVNADTGNLIIQNRDELLVSRGPDISILRTYNSQGLLDGDNNDNWRIGVYRKVTNLTGTVNTAGSTVTRVAEDGSESVYTYDTTLGMYVCHEGGGAYDTLAFTSATQTWTWSWTDGSTHLTEHYDAANGGRITAAIGQAVQDQDGNALTFSYNAAGQVTQVTDAEGGSTFLDYNGTDLTQLRTVNSSGQTTIRTRYGYDPSHRLTSVTTDLTPDVPNDAQTYVVKYTYEGTSTRVSTLTQTDGNNFTSGLTFGYTQVGNDWKVTSYTDALNNRTTINYTPNTSSVQASANANNAVLSTTETQTTTTTVAPYYTVANGDTWTSITQTVYGTSTATAVAALQTAMGGAATPTVGARLTVPQTLNYNTTATSAANGAVLSTTTTTTVAPYYTVVNGDTWTSITQTVYGTSDASAVAALQTALGNPALTIGTRLTVPQTLAYAGAGTTANANPAVLATSGWLGASLLETSATAASLPRIGFDGAGNAIAVWIQGSDLLVSRYTTTAGTWSAPAVLDNRTNTITAPQLYVDASGNAIATWVQSDGTANSTYVNRYVSGVWQGTELVETATVAIAEPAASINANGQAAVVWRQTNGTIQDLYANRYSGGVWSGTQLIESGTTTVATPGVAIDAQGNIQAVWQQSDGTANSIYTNRYTVGTGWLGASLRESSATAASLPSIGSDGAGNFIAVWLQGSDVLASRYVAASGTWSAATVLDNRTNTITVPQLYVDASGNAIATWVQSDGTAASTYVNRFVGGAWQGTELVETASAVVAEPKAAINANGQAAVVWRQTNGTIQDLYANRYSSGVWSGAQLIETGTTTVATPGVAIDTQGNIQAIWQQSNGTANSIYTNRYVANIAPYYTVQASDTWSSIAQTVYGDAAAVGPLQATLGNPTLAAGLRLTVPLSLSYAPVTAPVNAAAISTTDTQTTTQTLNLNTAALTGAASSWTSPAAIDTSGTDASQLLMNASNGGAAVSVWLQGGSLFASAYDAGAHLWSGPVLVSGTFTNISGVKLDVDQEVGNAIVTWIDTTTNRVYANRGLRSGGSVIWQGAQLVATASGTLAEASGAINYTGTSAVLWRAASGSTQSITASRWTGSAWGAAEQVTSGTAAITGPQVTSTNEDVIQVVWRASDGTAESLFSRGFAPATGWGTTTALETSSTPVGLFRVDTDVYADTNVTWVQGNDIFVNWGGEGQGWNGVVTFASSSSAIVDYSYSDSAGNSIVAWLAADGNLYAHRWNTTGVELIATGPGLAEVSADINSAGAAIVSWRSGNDLFTSSFSDGAWSTPAPLESSGLAAASPRVAIGEDGQQFAVWQQADGAATSIFASRVPTSNTLQNWATVDNISGAIGTWTYYSIDVPAGQSELFVGTAGGTGDADFYVRYGAEPDANTYDASGFDSSTADEAALIQNPAAGTWYIGVLAYTDISGVQLQTHYASGTAGTRVLQPGIAVSDLAGPHDTQRAFSFDVPAGTSDFTLSLTGQAGQDIDLYLSRGTLPTNTVFDFASNGSTENESISVNAPQAGTWFAVVDGYTNYSDAALVLHTNLGTNTPPTVQAGAAQSAVSGSTVTLSASGGDAQGAVTYQWTQLSGPAVTLTNATSATASFTAPGVFGATQLDFRVRVTDSQGASNTDLVHVIVNSASQSYTVQAGDTWASIATTLYGSASVATQLQTALGNPPLTAGNVLTGFPPTLTSTTTTTVTVPSYYTVRTGDTWASVTETVYGTSDANAQLALRDVLGNPPLIVGSRLTPMPASIRYAGPAGTTTATANAAVLSTTITTTVAPYYTVSGTDTWTSITQTVYGTSDASAAAALQTALGNPTLTAGLRLTVPSSLSYSVATSSNANNAVLSTTITTTTTVTVAPYYAVQQGDSWASIAQTVYGDAQAGSALQTAMGGAASPTVGAHLTVPQTLPYTKTIVNSVTTDVTDPLGLVTTMVANGQGQLTQILAPAVDGVRQSVSYAYNANGDVTQVTDGKGLITTYAYDANGNRTLERDAAGNTITRVFGTNNALLAETSYVVPDPDGAGAGQPASPLTTRYAYDSLGHLRFVVSGEGRVTEYRYNTFGQRVAAIQYTGSLYNLTGLTPTSTLTEANLTAFVGTADKTKTERVDSTYDFIRGQLSTTTSYAKVDAAGNGVTDGSQSLTQYVYDQAGNLLTTTDGRGSNTNYLYDGLGRLTTTIDAAGDPPTTIFYDDANRKTVLTSANGLVTTSTYDTKGELVSVMQSFGPVLGTTSYFYDADGRLRRTVDPTGVSTHILYDNADRKVATIDGTGSLTEYLYDLDNNLSKTIQYANPVVNVSVLTDPTGNPSNKTLADVRPPASAQDRITWNAYDSANRLVKSVDELGFVTQRFYDGAGRLTDTVKFATPISTAALGDTPAPGSINPPSTALDRLTRNFYDADGKLRGTLDGEGFLVEYKYDAAGQLVETVAYATPTSAGLRTTGTLSQLISTTPTSPADIHSYTLYNAKGQVVGQVDGERYLTEYVYDAAGNKIQSARYATRVNYTPGASIASIRPGAAPQDEVSTYTYTALNQLDIATDALGIRTKYSYDNVGNLKQTISALNTPEARTLNADYDKQGRLTQEQVDPSGLSLTAAYTYDADGRRTSTTDRNGNRTLFYYDADGHLTYTVSALGEVVENRYNALGQLIQKIGYAGRVFSGILPGLSGGQVTQTLTDAVAVMNAGDAVRNNNVRMVYDTAGRLVYAIDALGETTRNDYDARDNIVRVTTYATVLTSAQLSSLGSNPGVADVQLLVTSSSTDDQVERRVFDADDRRVYTIDALGFVEKNDYDALGEVIRTTRYAQAIPLSTPTTLIDVAAALAANANRVGVRGMSLPGVAGSYASTPDTTANSVTGDIDLRVLAAADNWSTGLGNLIAKDDGSRNVDYGLRLFQGKLAFLVNLSNSSNPIQLLGVLSTAAVNFAPGSAHWLRATRIASTGAVTFYTSDDYDPNSGQGSWTQLGATTSQGAVAGPIQDVGSTLRVGGTNTIAFAFKGKILYAEVRNGIGGAAVAKFNPANAGDTNAQGFVSSTGETWALSGSTVLDSPSLTENQVDTFAYDADGRLIYHVDAHGQVTRNDYDSQSNLIKTTDYATQVGISSLGTNPTLASIQAQVASIANDSLDHATRRVYDADNRLVYKIDALGFVDKNDYDALGQVIHTTRYAQPTAIPLNTPLTLAAVAAAVAASAIPPAVRALNLSGAIGGYASTPDSATNSVTGDLDVRVQAAAAAWTPATDYTHLIGKWDGAGGAGVSWYLAVRSTGALYLQWVDGGGSYHNAMSTVTTGLADGAKKWVRAALDVDNGAGGNTVTFYTSDDGISWTQFGAAVTASGVTSVADSAGAVTVGTRDHGIAGLFAGKIYYADFRNGINGAIAARFNPADAGNSDAPKFVSSSGETWTLSGSAVLDPPSFGEHQADFAYDAAGRLVYQVDGEGEVTRRDYDAAGDVIQTTGYAALVDVASLGSAPTLASIQARVGASSIDHVEQRVFDADGRVLFNIDAAGYVTQFAYDGHGNAIQESRYADKLRGTFTPGVAPQIFTSAPQTQPTGAYVVTNLLDQVTSTIYDAANRPVYLIDPAGFVNQRFYDAKGNVVKEVQYANPVVQGTFPPGIAPLFFAPQIVASNGDRTSRYFYDADGRMRYSADPKGYVTERRFDGFGREIQRIVYPNPVAGLDGATLASLAVLFPSVPADAVVTGIHYDNAGRVLDTIDGKGVVTRSIYDAFGNATDKIEAQGLPEQRTTHSLYDALGRLTEQTTGLTGPTTAFDTTNASTKRFRFDAFGNQIAYIDPRGVDLAERDTDWATAERQRLGYSATAAGLSANDRANLIALYTTNDAFDAINRKLSSTDPLGNVTRTDYDAFGNVVRAIDPNGSAGFLYYDRRNLQVAQIDPEGDLTEYGYDAFGNKTSTIRYAIPVSVSYDPSRPLDQLRPKGATLPGVSGSYFSTPDSAANSVTGDIDMRVLLTHDSWAPATAEEFVTKDDLATNRDYGLRFNSGSTGKLQFVGSPDGVTTFPDANGVTGGFSVVSTAATGFAPGSTHWVRVTRSASTGQIKFYTSDDYDPSANTGTWTQLGDTINAPAGTIHDGTSLLQVGSRTGASPNDLPFKGTIYYADVRNGIDALAPVAKFNPSVDAGTLNTSGGFTSSTGEVWSRSGPATAITAGSPQDEITTTSYDTLNRVTQIVDPEQHSELFGYDRNTNNVSFHQDKNTNVTTYEYDADGNKIAEHLPVTSSLPQWHGMESVATYSGGFTSMGQSVLNDNGQGARLWIHSDLGGSDQLFVQLYDAVGGWRAITRVDAAPNGVSMNPDPSGNIAIGADGKVFVIWMQRDATAATWSVYGRTYVPGQGWQPPELLESSTTNALGATLISDGRGNAAVAWQQLSADGATTQIVVRRYIANLGWQGLETLSAPIQSVGGPSLSYASNGDLVARWTDYGARTIELRRYVSTVGWQMFGSLSMTFQGAAIGGFVNSVDIGFDGGGNALLVWDQHSGNISHIFASRYLVGSGWQPIEMLDTGSEYAQYPKLIMDASGNATVVWQQKLVTASTDNIYIKRYVVGSGWQANEQFASGSSSSTPRLVLDYNNKLTLIWTKPGGMYRRIYSAATGWGPEELFYGGASLVATNSVGEALVASLATQSGQTQINVDVLTSRAQVVNRYEYDALGNKKKEILAQGRSEERVTQYVYDKNNRLIETVEPQVLTQQTGAAAPTGSVQLGQVGTATYAFTEALLGGSALVRVDVSWSPIIGFGNGNTKIVWNTGTSLGVFTQIVGPEATSVSISSIGPNVLLAQNDVFDVAIYKQTSEGDVLITRATGNYPQGSANPSNPIDATSQIPNLVFTGQPPSGQTMHVVYWPALDSGDVTEVDLKSYASGTLAGMTPGPLAPGVLYVYDAQLVDANGEVVNVVNGTFSSSVEGVVSTSINALPLPVGVLQTPLVFKEYDAAGNLVKETDAKGNSTYSYYDVNNRLIGTVDAERTLRRYFYDAAGNVIRQRTYGDRVPDAVGLAAVPDPAAIAGMDPANFRETTYRYNANNVLTETDTQAVLVYNRTSGLNPSQVLVTGRQYDRNGNVILEIDANGNKTYSYYDKAGRRIAQVDASRYLTTWAYDAEGNILRKTSYATDLPIASITTSSDPSALAVQAAAGEKHSEDRVCLYAYDRMNRLIQETTLGVNVSTVVTDTSLTTLGTSTERLTDVVVRQRYDNAGNLTARIQDTAETDFLYDGLNRLVQEIDPSFTDYQGLTVRSTTIRTYDGVGNLQQVNENGGVTSYEYDPHGNLTREVDANNNPTRYYYDLNGNVTVKHTRHVNPDGTAPGVDALYDYDKLNRQIARTEVKNFTYSTKYDTYGEITGKGLKGGNQEFEEYEEYDRAGRLIKTNKDDGVNRAYLYDANGNATATIQSGVQDIDLRSMTIDQIAHLPVSAVQRTESEYDAKNQLTGVFQAPIQPAQNDPNVQQVWVDALNDPFLGGSVAAVRGGPVTYDFSASWNTGGVVFHVPASLTVSWAPITGYGDGNIRVVWQTNGETATSIVAADKTTTTLSTPSRWFAQDLTTYTVSIYKETFAGLVLITRNPGVYVWNWPGGPGFAPAHSDGQIADKLIFNGQRSEAQILKLWIWSVGTSQQQQPNFLLTPIATDGASSTPIKGQFAFDPSGYPPGQYNYEYQTVDASGTVLDDVKGAVNLGNGWRRFGLVAFTRNSSVVYPKVVEDAQGNAIAVWGQMDPATAGIYASRYIAATGTWQGVVQLTTGNPMAFWPQAALDGKGGAAVIWIQQDSGTVHARRYDATTGAWQPDQTIGSGNANLQIATDSQGNAVAVWEQTQSGGASNNILASRYVAATGTWQTPQVLASGSLADFPQIALDSRGNAIALWQQYDGTRYGIYSRRYDAASGAWTNAQALQSVLADATDSRVSFDAQGNALAVWCQFDGTRYNLWGSRYVAASGSWQAAQFIGSNNIGNAANPEIALDSQGNAIAVWQQYDGTHGSIYASRYTAGAWQGTQLLETDNRGYAAGAQIGMDGQGNATVVWEQSDGTSTNIYSNRYSAGSNAWSGAQAIETDPRDANSASIAVNPSGTAIAIWNQSDINWNVLVPEGVVSKLALTNVLSDATQLSVGRTQRYNAFGQIDREVDAYGHATDLSYNTRGDLVQKLDPQTSYTSNRGDVVQGIRPATLYYYDYLDRLVGTQDAEGHKSTQSYDAAGHLLLEINPNELQTTPPGFKRYRYDVHGDRRIAIDERNWTDSYTYDLMHHVTRIDRPTAVDFLDTSGAVNAQRFDTYAYDEEGRRIRHTDALNNSDLTYYDSTGRVTRTVSAGSPSPAGGPVRAELGGTTTQYRYLFGVVDAAAGRVGTKVITTEQTAQGPKTLVDTKDYFGRLLKHGDLGGHQFFYTYNKAGWLIQQSGDTNLATPGNEQNITHTYYQNGLLRETFDAALNARTAYEYDRNGNVTFEGYEQTTSAGPVYYQTARARYDELNRVIQVDDPKYSITYAYDRNGNRRHVVADYHDGLNGAPQGQDYWYDYDAMNRFTVTQGKLLGGQIVASTTGTQITYYADGQRSSAMYTVGGTGGTTYLEAYQYADGLLTQTTITNVNPGGQGGSATRKYDAVGRVKSYAESGGRQSTYDYAPDGMVVREDSNTTGTTMYAYDDAGTLLRTLNQQGSTTTTTLYSYEYWDAPKQSKIQIQAANPNAPDWKPGFSNFIYDVNGHLTEVRDNVAQRSLRYALDARGLVLQRNELTGSVSSKTQSYYYLNGTGIGDSGFTPSRTDYASVLASRGTNPKTATPISSADFGSNFMPINDRYPATTPGTYTLQQSDVVANAYDQTLRNVALAVWGDASLWYIIADANGLNADSVLEANEVLVIPNVVSNIHNSASTFQVYDAGEHIGDVSPTLPDPPPPPHPNKGCGTLGMIIMVAIVVVVTIYTAGAATALLGATVSGAAGAGVGATGLAVLGGAATTGGLLGAAAGVTAAAIGGAVGSIAGQGVGMLTGNVDKFSWTQVGLSAIGAGVTAGLGGTNLAGTLSNGMISGDAALAANAALSNSLTQQIARGTGYQDGFNWRSVAVSAMAAPIAKRIGDFIGGDVVGKDAYGNPVRAGTAFSGWAGDFGTRLTTSLATGVTTQALRRRYNNGQLDYAQIAADAFANSVVENGVRNGAQGPTTSATVSNSSPLVEQDTGDHIIFGKSNSPTPYTNALADTLMGQVADSMNKDRTSPYVPVAAGEGSVSMVDVAPRSQSGLDPKGLPSALLDTAKGAWNGVLDLVEATPNLLTGALPGGIDYNAFLSDYRAKYDTPSFGQTVEVLTGLGAAKVLSEIGAATRSTAIPGFSAVESGVIQETQGILGSAEMAQIRAAHVAGEPLSVTVGGRLIQYEPSLPASGMTLFGENGFVIGREAFASNTELQSTVLHELYRLNTSASASGVSAGLAAQETKAAFDFAARATKHLGGN